MYTLQTTSIRSKWLNSIALSIGIFAVATAAGFTAASFSVSPSQKPTTRRSTDPPSPAKGKLGQDLFLAIDHRDLRQVQALLKKGADANARNGLEFTPIYIAVASHQPEIVQALLDAGAKPDAESNYGTPLLFAAASGNVPGVMQLLELGANPKATRDDGMTALMIAANTGVPPIVEALLKRQGNPNDQNEFGTSALSLAARGGNEKVCSILIEAGAKVNTADSDGQTPLMGAAVTGNARIVKLLLANGANPNAKDGKGRTALNLACRYGDFPEVARALVEGGADPKLSDSLGKVASFYAASRRYTKTTAVLGSRVAPNTKAQSARAAAEASLSVLQSSMLKFSQNVNCISCHHEGLGRIALGLGQSHGLSVSPKLKQLQKARVAGAVNAMLPLHQGALKSPEVMKQVPLIEINEIGSTYPWFLTGMAAAEQKPDRASEAMAMVLARQQSKDGSWTFSAPRVPMQSSFFSTTALAVKSLMIYGPKSQQADIADRIRRARAWLAKTPAKTSEDRTFRLLGLKWAGASTPQIKSAMAEVRADQHSDGGWAQLPTMNSDAYATGQALYSLNTGGGVPTSDSVYKRGLDFLIRTQDPDGSWFANKRANPANNFFNAGFPHGESQYSSFNATSWAMIALVATLPTKHKSLLTK